LPTRAEVYRWSRQAQLGSGPCWSSCCR